MIYVDIVNINQKQHYDLIQHILKSCDEISFHLPGVCDNGKPMLQKYWQEYHKNNEFFLQKCFNNGAKQSCSRHYQGMKLGQYSRIIHVKPFPFLKNMLLENHLFDWLAQNAMPEDVCFFSKKEIRFFTCSHDQDFNVYNEVEEDIDFFKKNGFIFWIR